MIKTSPVMNKSPVMVKITIWVVITMWALIYSLQALIYSLLSKPIAVPNMKIQMNIKAGNFSYYQMSEIAMQQVFKRLFCWFYSPLVCYVFIGSVHTCRVFFSSKLQSYELLSSYTLTHLYQDRVRWVAVSLKQQNKPGVQWHL